MAGLERLQFEIGQVVQRARVVRIDADKAQDPVVLFSTMKLEGVNVCASCVIYPFRKTNEPASGCAAW